MKKLIVTDTHLGLYSDSDVWLDIVLNFFKHITKYCYQNKISQIIHLGDFFHNRKSLNTKTQNVAHRIAKVIGTVSNLNMTVIVGNHDCYFKNEIHPNTLEMLKNYPHIHIIDTPTVDDGILLLPWGTVPSVDDAHNAAYCFGHFAINGFHMNDSYVCRDGISRTTMKDFELVLSGHFHTPSRQDNVQYVGAPYGQTFHDAFGIRGFHIFDEGKLEFIQYDKAPKFIKIRSEQVEQRHDIEEIVRGNIIRLYFDKDYGTNKNQEIVDKVMEFEPLQFSTVFSGESGEEETIEIDAKIYSREDIADEFIDTMEFAENIKVPTLKAMFKKLMKEAEKK